ncbi:MXAN_6640 family putative metalloprotease [Nocardioides stalactiti]|uniref:MXAN_6640 family putative metalloprotease n=1 Tax=Nocardioides stalactiti TaxID=2755356 RepID=UPI0016012540|nr:MXAN_6640 family putative metalloprotease [Nocardioides stalactiti]
MLRLRTSTLLAWALLAALLVPGPGSAEPTPSPSPAPRAARAIEALARVTSLLDGGPGIGHSGGTTMALRDLALLQDALPVADRARASSYLSRPTANPDRCPDFSCYRTNEVVRACTSVVCVHYVRREDDADNGVPTRDTDDDGRPDYVEKVLDSVTRVHRTYVAAGYRPPVGDGSRGGDARPDVYLAQIGDQALYGYCTTDASSVPQHGATWAYCVLDNDYRHEEFPRHTPIENMQVTAAHEYFHAVQFGYDIGEDAWFMEATATWVEDEVFDRVDDNVGFLRIGPMGQPTVSLDSQRSGFYYGAWIFFRHLTEQVDRSRAGLPVLVRTMWRLADADGDAPDLYSLAAVETALAEQGTTIADEFLRMAAANLHPQRWYDEGRLYPTTDVQGAWILSPQHPARRMRLTQNHLTSSSYRFVPTGTRAAGWQLRVGLDLAPLTQGSRALARVFLEDGSVRTTVVELSETGDAEISVEFSSREVSYVELTIANASTRYKCNVATGWSCHGRPLDQDVAQLVEVEAQQG